MGVVRLASEGLLTCWFVSISDVGRLVLLRMDLVGCFFDDVGAGGVFGVDGNSSIKGFFGWVGELVDVDGFEFSFKSVLALLNTSRSLFRTRRGIRGPLNRTFGVASVRDKDRERSEGAVGGDSRVDRMISE